MRALSRSVGEERAVVDGQRGWSGIGRKALDPRRPLRAADHLAALNNTGGSHSAAGFPVAASRIRRRGRLNVADLIHAARALVRRADHDLLVPSAPIGCAMLAVRHKPTATITMRGSASHAE